MKKGDNVLCFQKVKGVELPHPWQATIHTVMGTRYILERGEHLITVNSGSVSAQTIGDSVKASI